jgi:tol-pal system protein YbgF
MRPIVAVALLASVAGCSSLTPTSDPVYLRLTDMEARLIRIERVVENESLIELAGEIAQLRAETQSLRGEIETLRFNSEGAADRQRDLYVDLDQRLASMEQRGTAPLAFPGIAGNAGGAPAAVAGMSDQQAYDAAFELIQARQYQDGSTAFTSFLLSYPTSVLRDNAQYWLAETYYVQREFAAALPEFERVIGSYPQSAKLPDALLKIGYCNYELKNWDAARQALTQVTRLYPDTTAARLAEQRLSRIAAEVG